MVDYLKEILEEYKFQLSNSTDSKMKLFWEGAVFAMEVAVLSAQRKEGSE